MFLTSDPASCRPRDAQSQHNKVLHEHNVIYHRNRQRRASICPNASRWRVIGEVLHVRLRFGFMESPNVPKALVIARSSAGSSTSWQRRSCVAALAQAVGAVGHAAMAGSSVHRHERSANDATDYSRSDGAGRRGWNSVTI